MTLLKTSIKPPSRRAARAQLLTMAVTALLFGALLVAHVNAQAGAEPPAAPGAGVGAAAQPGNLPAGGPANGQGEETPQEKMSFLELLGKGEWFMVPIALCSLIGLAIIFERFFALRRGVIIPPSLLPGLKSVLRDTPEDRQRALDYCHANPSPASRVLAVGIRKMPQGEETVEQAIEDAGANEVFKLRKNLRLLFGVSSVAPMIGLLGTVWGMIEAFQQAAIHGLGKADKLAGGIYEALVTTFAGLCVAIPVLVFYFYFLGKIEDIITRMNDTCEEFVEHAMQNDGHAGGGQQQAALQPQPSSSSGGDATGFTPQPA